MVIKETTLRMCENLHESRLVSPIGGGFGRESIAVVKRCRGPLCRASSLKSGLLLADRYESRGYGIWMVSSRDSRRRMDVRSKN